MDVEHNQKSTGGQLFIIATPIGNLGDLTHRAVETLKQVDFIAAEDTRTSRRLLKHYGVKTRMVSYHEHNEQAASKRLLAQLLQGMNIALISDAGTPLISDPGYRLVNLARQNDIRVTPIPGPCSPIAALSASGLPTDSFTFIGFLPRSAAARQKITSRISDAQGTCILMESPNRLLRTLRDLRDVLPGSREICVARELTKIHEEFVCGTPDQVYAEFKQKGVRGEVVVLVGPGSGEPKEVTDAQVFERLSQHDLPGLTPSEKAKRVAQALGVPRKRVYALMLEHDKDEHPQR